MSKRSFLRKSAISLTATLGLGGTVAYSADIILNGNTLNVGSRTIDANNALRGAYYDPGANPPEASFNSVSGIRALEAQYIADGVTGVMEANLTINLDFDQANGNPFGPITGDTVDFGTNDTIAAVWSGELVVAPTAAGAYNFGTASDDGSVIHIDGDYVLNNNVYQGRTRRDRTGYVLTPGVHTIVMGWYEGGSGANMTAYMSGGPTNEPEEILNPSSPLPGLTFRKVTYNTDATVNGMNVIVNANSGLNIQQDTPPAFGSLTMANNVTLNVDSITTASFTGTNVGATSTFNVTGGRVQTGALNTGGAVATINKTGAGNLDLNRPAGNVPAGTVFNVQAGSLTVGTSGAGSLGGGTVNLTGGILAIDANLLPAAPDSANGLGWSAFDTKSNIDAVLNSLTPVATRAIVDLEINFPRGDGNLNDGGTNDLPDPIFNVDGANLNVPLTGNDDLIARFTGKLNVTSAGPTQFGLGSNDGSVMFLDLDTGAGTNWQKVADNNRFGTPVTTGDMQFRGTVTSGNVAMDGAPPITQPAVPNLAVSSYDFIIGYFNENRTLEGGIEAYWAPSGGTGGIIPASSLSQVSGDFYSATAAPLTQAVNVTANSTIHVVSGNATASTVNVNPGVTLAQTGNPLTITNTRSTGAGTVTLAPSGTLNVVNLLDDGKAVTFTAGGTGQVVLTKAGGPGLGAGSSVGATTGGRLVATNDSALVSTLGNTPVTLSGGTLELRVAPVEGTTRVPGLQGGRVAGAFNLTAFPTVPAGIDLKLSRAQTTNNAFFGGDNGTWVYTGEVRIPDTDGDKTPGPIAFGEQFDDGVLLRIDGVEFMNNNAWQEPTSSGEIELVDNEPDGKGTAGDGWFSFEARFGQGGGGVGPNTGWAIGFGIDRNGTDGFDGQGPGALPEQYVEPVEPGDMSLFRTFGFQAVDFKGNVTATQNSKLELTGPTTIGVSQIGNLAANTGATLTVLGNRLKVNDISTQTGGVVAFTSTSGAEIAGSITGAGTLRADRGVTLDVTRSGSASTGSPLMDVKKDAVIRFAPGSGNTFGGSAVSGITNEGLLRAVNGITDLSNATVTTTNVPGFVPGLTEVQIEPSGQGALGDPYGAGLTALIPESTVVKLEMESAQFRDTDATRADPAQFRYPAYSTQVYHGQIFIPDTDNDGRAGPIAFGEHFDDVIFVKVDGQTVLNDTRWDWHTESGEIELPAGKGAGFYDFEARVGRGGGPNGQQLPWDDFGIGMDITAPFNPAGAVNDTAAGGVADANEAEYVKPRDSGNGSLFRAVNKPSGNVQVDSGATMRIGTLIGANQVDIAATGRLELHNGTSKVLALNIAGGPGAATAVLDLTDADIAVQTTNKAADLAAFYADLKQGFNQGDWKGLGITSSTAANNTNTDTGVAVVDNALLGLTNFGGRPVDANSILLKYTYYGDIDQNGQVDADDLTVFASNFGRTSGATQIDGDIDFNGSVDADDLTIFANNFNKGVGAPLADAAASVQAVPEPGSLVLAGLGAAGILAGVAIRRRRK